MVPLKYINDFWKTLEMPLIICEINLNLNLSRNCAIVAKNADRTTAFLWTNTKLYVPVITLSTHDNAKLLEQLKSGFEKQLTRININQKYIQKNKANIYIALLFQIFKEQLYFCFMIWQWSTINKLQMMLSSDCRNEKTLMFWLIGKTFLINH